MFNRQSTIAATLAAAAFATLVLPAPALAADSPPGGYIGGNLGLQTSTNLDCPSGAKCETKFGRSGKLYGGYNLDTTQFAVAQTTISAELMAFRSGDADSSFHGAGGVVKGVGSFDGVAVALRNEVKFNDLFSLTARLGLARTSARVDYSGGGSGSGTANGLLFGLGTAFALDKNWSLHADWDRVQKVRYSGKQEAHANMFSVGASYKF